MTEETQAIHNNDTINQADSSPEAATPYQQILQQIINTSWDDYLNTINSLSAGYEISSCLKLLNVADELLNQNNDFSQSTQLERFLIGGISDSKVKNSYDFNTNLMGSMQGFASFKKLLKTDPAGLAKLLKIIPTLGPIDGWHFMQFVDGFKQLFADNGFKQAYVFPATRLLSMKRPDQFVALDADSAATFCQALAIKPLKNQDFQRYWDEIILPLQKAPWYKMHQPIDPAQIPIHRSRFALIERLLCTPIDFQHNLKSGEAEVVVSAESNLAETLTEPAKQTLEQTLQANTLQVNAVQVNAVQVNTAQTNTSKETFAAETSAQTGVEHNLSADFNHYTNKPIVVKQATKQPKKMTIAKKKSAKVNQAAATKLMSQYYFANKQQFAKVDMGKNREAIIAQLIEGESVEDVFAEFLKQAK
jgi:hypothetical protein